MNRMQFIISTSWLLRLVSFSCLYITRCNGLAIDRDVILMRSSASSNTESIQCGFLGNSDILGIGIRIGYYTQALSVCFANYCVRSEAKGLRSVNLLFLVALFIGLAWLAHQTEDTYSVEVYLLLRLLFATWYVGVLDRSKFSKKQWRKSHMRVIVRECSLLALLAYTTWFAWAGLDHLKETPCGTYIFFVVKINLYGIYRSVFKALSTFALCFGIIKQLDTAAQFFQRRRNSSVQDPTYYPRLQQSLLASATLKTQFRASGSEILDAAIRTPLPQSPTCERNSDSATASSEMMSHENRSPPLATSKRDDFPSLEDLSVVENYLRSILEVDLRDHSQWCYQIKWIPLRMFLPSVHSPATLRRRFATLYSCRPFRLSVLIPLFRHIKSLCIFPLYSYGFMLEAALLSPLHKQVITKAVIPALALQKAQLPPHRPAQITVYHAVASLTMCIELILNVELSIHWNRITGMGNIGAVGQLIPAIIGVGGLARVFWVWWSKGNRGAKDDDGIDMELRECAEVYQRLKKEKEAYDEAQRTEMSRA